MPSEISHTASMQLQVNPSLPLRLLNKGPEYLRSQIEGDRRGRLSAVERLAADKAKYVKSQAARGCKVEPSGLSSSASEEGSSSSSGASSSTETYLGTGSPQQQLLPGIVRRLGSKRQLRPDSLVIYRQKCEFVRGAAATSSSRSSKDSRSLVRRLLPGSGGRGDKQLSATGGGELAEIPEPAAPRGGPAASPAAPRGGPAASPAAPRGGPAASPAAPREVPAASPAASRGAVAGRTKEPLKRRGVGVGLQRSHSDLSCRYSRACSGLDSFFEHCGLEPEVIEDLAREKFVAASDTLALKFRSVSSPDSGSELSRHSSTSSGSDQLRGPNKPPPSALSVIERNARIIQWLYSCKRAKESKIKAAAALV
ncbi:protein FAM110C [Narcine bancroftii]|uniref:protein FAM110C n=1 Tax=Narcine bancroftii TaxID=1343680 RepID=UPI0038312D4E